ncbi:MAG TPA: hypothetical protein DHV55_17170 [Clostridiaceae bacterium]|nr:hypothetical protein [Clostridiaceae bacterium]
MPEAVDPFLNKEDIRKIKQHFIEFKQYRDLAIFILGINTGLAPKDIVTLKYSDVINNVGEIRDYIFENGYSMGKLVFDRIPLNISAKKALQDYTSSRSCSKTYLFPSKRSAYLSVNAYTKIISHVAAINNIDGHYGFFSLRKTFLYHYFHIHQFTGFRGLKASIANGWHL